MIVIDSFDSSDLKIASFTELKRQIYSSSLKERVEPNLDCLLAWRGNKPAARAILQMSPGLISAKGPLGLISHYESIENPAGVFLLKTAVERLLDLGAKRILGPMDGSSWGTYRLALARSKEESNFEPPYFFSEPRNPETYSDHFVDAGFKPIDLYESRYYGNLKERNRRAEEAEKFLQSHDVTFRSLKIDSFEEELEAIYEVCCVAFEGNAYYKSITFEVFKELYLPLKSILDPDLVRIAEADGKMVAFVIAFPDLLDSKRLILKTLARIPGVKFGGVGLVLAEQVHRLANEKGYEAVIHALMHEKNVSTRLSFGFESRLFRRYALFEYAGEGL